MLTNWYTILYSKRNLTLITCFHSLSMLDQISATCTACTRPAEGADFGLLSSLLIMSVSTYLLINKCLVFVPFLSLICCCCSFVCCTSAAASPATAVVAAWVTPRPAQIFHTLLYFQARTTKNKRHLTAYGIIGSCVRWSCLCCCWW